MTSEDKDKIKIKRTRRRVYETPEPETPETSQPQPPPKTPKTLKTAKISKTEKQKPQKKTTKKAVTKKPQLKPTAPKTEEKKEKPPQVTQAQLKADRIIKRNVYWSMGIALLPFPIFDMAALTALQVKMAHDISKAYGITFNQSRGKAIVVSLLGSLNIYTLSSIAFRGFLKFIPGPGYILGAASASAFSAATTYAVGKVFVQHYEMGGKLLDLNPDTVKEYFQQQYQQELNKNSSSKKESV